MNNTTQEIHRERIDYLVNTFSENWDDAKHATKAVGKTMWGCFSDLAATCAGKEYKISDLELLIRYGKEKIGEALATLDALADELDDIEKELNHEVNNAND